MTGRLLGFAVRAALGGRVAWLLLAAVLAASRTHTHLPRRNPR